MSWAWTGGLAVHAKMPRRTNKPLRDRIVRIAFIASILADGVGAVETLN